MNLTAVVSTCFCHGAPGSEAVLARIRDATYTLLIETWPFPSEAGYREAIDRNYRRVGGCALSFFFGGVNGHFFVRRDIDARFVPPPGRRCGGDDPGATSGSGSRTLTR